MGHNFLNMDASSFDNPTALGYVGLGHFFTTVVLGIAGSIGHVSPTLGFNEVLVSNYFGSPEPLWQFLYTSYKREGLLQSYKASIFKTII